MTNKTIIQKIVLGAVVVHQGKVLILQRSINETVYPGLWELPSGKKEPLEESEKALVREVQEETELNVKILLPISVFDYQVEKPDVIRDSTQINFLVEIIDGDSKVKTSEEHQAIAWISEHEVDNYEISKATKSAIVKAFKLMKHLNSSNE